MTCVYNSRVLLDGIELLKSPLSKLFTLVYERKQIPEQWLVSKIIPVHKKGSKQMIIMLCNQCYCQKMDLSLSRVRKLVVLLVFSSRFIAVNMKGPNKYI